MDKQKIPTRFLPAERLPASEVASQTGTVASNSLIGLLLNAMPEIVLILNAQRQIVFANQALADLLGIGDLATVYGLRPGEALDCIHAFEDKGGCGTTAFCTTCGMAKSVATAQKGYADIQECHILRRQGVEALEFRVHAYPFKALGADFTLYALTDISDEMRRRALERLFFHDILNTAGGVSGAAELLATADGEEFEQMRSIVSRLSRRLVDEIMAQRDLAAAESGDLAVRIEQLNVADLLTDLAELYRRHEVGRDRQIVVEMPDTPLTIKTDGRLLGRVIGNLVKNALEASQPMETVTIACRVVDDEIEFTVNNPAVMPEEVKLQLFQRSFSTKGTGRGLGTYSVRLLTERYLAGRVWFVSDEDGGTTFYLRYPLVHPRPEY
ncbi:MAG: PAS domain-containing sensor histidine kinase [Candidatus Sumerlaeaceae bacterium]|nr:PAS domain-containing sensor histidine kinase [Candidatus Sumerlaeaceae bacterium]